MAERDLGRGRWSQLPIPALPFPGCVAINKMLNLSLSLLAYKMGITVVSPRGAPWGSCETICWCAGLRTQPFVFVLTTSPSFQESQG